MARWLALALAAAFALWQPGVYALGLAQIRAQSSLDEPFEAEIELRNVGGLTAGELVASLGSSEDFERAGVERFFYLSSFEFEADLSDPARPLIHVTSDEPVDEPYVNFLMEVLWPNGRLLREYTVLLDPPTYSRGVRAGAERAGSGGASRSEAARERVQRGSTASGRPSSAAPTGAPEPVGTTAADAALSNRAGQRGAPATGRLSDGEYGLTDRDDTLWQIATEVRPSGDVSVQQTMLALRRANPEAFIHGNINLLKAGYSLEVPDSRQIRRLSAKDASMQVSEHNRRWKNGEPGPGVARAPAEAPAASGGELRVVSADKPEGNAGDEPADAGAGLTAAADRPAETTDGRGNGTALRTELEQVRGEKASLAAQLSAQEERLASLEGKIQARDAELAQMQQQLAAMRNAIQRRQRADDANAAVGAGAAASEPRWRFGGLGITGVAVGALALVAFLTLVLAAVRRRAAGTSKADRLVVEADTDHVAMRRSGPESPPAAPPRQVRHNEEDESDAIREADVYVAYGQFPQASECLHQAIEEAPQRTDLRLKLMEVNVETGDANTFNEQADALQVFADAKTMARADELAQELPGAVTSRGEVSEDTGHAETHAANLNLDLDTDTEQEESGKLVTDLESLDIDLDLETDGHGAPEGEATGGIPMGTGAVAASAPTARGLDAPVATTEHADVDAEEDLELDFELDEPGFGPGRRGESRQAEDEEPFEFDLELDWEGSWPREPEAQASPPTRVVTVGDGGGSEAGAAGVDPPPAATDTHQGFDEFDLEVLAALEEPRGDGSGAAEGTNEAEIAGDADFAAKPRGAAADVKFPASADPASADPASADSASADSASGGEASRSAGAAEARTRDEASRELDAARSDGGAAHRSLDSASSGAPGTSEYADTELDTEFDLSELELTDAAPSSRTGAGDDAIPGVNDQHGADIDLTEIALAPVASEPAAVSASGDDDRGMALAPSLSGATVETESGVDRETPGMSAPAAAPRTADDEDRASGVAASSATAEARAESAASEPETAAGPPQAGEEAVSGREWDLFADDVDEAATKLELARAYVDMGDEDGAREILGEIVEEGNQTQQRDARELLDQLG